jgi:hypothetical protein
MQLQFAIIFVAFISIKLIRPSTKTRQGDNFNVISKDIITLLNYFPYLRQRN